MPREAAAAAAASPSTAATATVPSALLPSHGERRSKGACLCRADVLVASRCAVVVEVALAWRCFLFLKREEEAKVSFVAAGRAKKKMTRGCWQHPNFSSPESTHSLTNRASSLVSNLAKDNLDLKKKRACNYQQEIITG